MRIYDVVMMGTMLEALNCYYELQEDSTFLAEAMLCEILDIVMDANLFLLTTSIPVGMSPLSSVPMSSKSSKTFGITDLILNGAFITLLNAT